MKFSVEAKPQGTFTCLPIQHWWLSGPLLTTTECIQESTSPVYTYTNSTLTLPSDKDSISKSSRFQARLAKLWSAVMLWLPVTRKIFMLHWISPIYVCVYFLLLFLFSNVKLIPQITPLSGLRYMARLRATGDWTQEKYSNDGYSCSFGWWILGKPGNTYFALYLSYLKCP